MQEKKELFEHYKFVADKGQTPLRVDKFLMNFIEHATRTKIQHYPNTTILSPKHNDGLAIVTAGKRLGG